MVSYIEQLNLFSRYNRELPMETGEQVLWYRLMQINNECCWQKNFKVDNRRLLSETGINTEKTLGKYRKQLVKRGLVKFQRGFKGHSSTYTMVPLEQKSNGLIRPKGVSVDDVEFNDFVNEDVQIPLGEEEKTKKKGEKGKKKKQDRIDYKGIIDYFNAHRNKMPAVRSLSDDRRKHIRARIEEHSLERVKEVIDIAERSDFLNGLVETGNGRTFTASLDWLMKPSNFVKVLDGNYENREPAMTEMDYLIGLGNGALDINGNPVTESYTDYEFTEAAYELEPGLQGI